MRKLFYGLAAAALVVVVAAFGLHVLMRNGSALDAESKVYVDGAMVAITARWDADELWKRSTPQFRAIAKADELRAFFSTTAAALGPLTEYRGASGQATMAIQNFSSEVSADYVAKASFQNGDADFKLSMIKIGDTWMIEGFHISSPALLKNVAGLRG